MDLDLAPYAPWLAIILVPALVAAWDWAKAHYDWLPARPDTAAVTALITEMLKDGKINAADIPTLMAFIEQLRGQGAIPHGTAVDAKLLGKLAAAYTAAKYPDPAPPTGGN